MLYFVSFLVSTDWTERAFWAGIYSMDYQYYFVKYTNPEEITCTQWEYRFKFKSKFWMLLFELFLKRRITDYLAVFHNELKEKCCANPNTA
ncbi:hypothetical protein AAEO57_00440 [Flavobacterium sp. DGU38]|uniref:Polyketide cyclase / dehydrase and lipid transport n=1 Tax=Flavobacterium calami TaxID=3139144 RepID=A0ABU9IIF7_9FLAO